MAQKFLSAIKDFKKNDLFDFLKKNGYGEYEEILINGQVTDGEKFLGLNELDVTKWKLPLPLKKKLWSFLTELKTNPQKFIVQVDAEVKSTTNVNRRHSFSRTNTNIREKLELVIGPKSVVKKAIPTPNSIEPDPVDDYLPMDKIQEAEDDGYLIPIETSMEQEEHVYEPTPTTKIVTNFITSLPTNNTSSIVNRAPLALPRESTEYILGPDDLATTQDNDSAVSRFPRVQLQTNVPFKSKLNTPSPTTQLTGKHETVADEEVAYEPIDYGGSLDSVNTDSTEQINAETLSLGSSDGGTISRFFNRFRKPTNSESSTEKIRKNVKDLSFQPEQSNVKATKSSKENSLERGYSLRDRPLPPLPARQCPLVKEKRKPSLSGTTYENVTKYTGNGSLSEETLRKPRPPSPVKLCTNEKLKSEKSKSENDLVSENNGKPHRNVKTGANKKPKYPESYEIHLVKDTKDGKKPLPLPPNTLPQISLLPVNADHQEEDDEYYNNCLFNLNDEPFYRNTDRKGARQLLFDLEDGAFLFRPSKSFFLTLSLKYNHKYINLGIEKTENNNIRLNTEGEGTSPEFPTLRAFVAYFTTNLLTFQHQGKVVEIFLQKYLPKDRF